jgi:RHH-type transcriptional regulator, proline utilization regulon repressor / proline dehydrogenase / delta 1-pyrroline-5-carboxylate dehydrogenase
MPRGTSTGSSPEINATGYALTLGVHSRIDARAREDLRQGAGPATSTSTATWSARWSACSPSAVRAVRHRAEGGRPGYLHRFMTERTLTINTSAVGGNASLLSLSEG